MKENANPYKPEIVTIEDTWQETYMIVSLKPLKLS